MKQGEMGFLLFRISEELREIYIHSVIVKAKLYQCNNYAIV